MYLFYIQIWIKAILLQNKKLKARVDPLKVEHLMGFHHHRITKLSNKICIKLCILIFDIYRLRFQRAMQAVLDFPLKSSEKKAFLFNFQCNSMTDLVKFCTSGTLVKKYPVTFLCRAGGPNFQDKWQKLTIYNFFTIKTAHLDVVMLHIRRLYALCMHDTFAITLALS